MFAYDQLGFVYTELPGENRYGLEQWTEHLLSFMQAVGIKRAHLVGNSMGAAIALAAAANHLSETYPGLAPTDAYAIQSVLFDKKLARGVRLVGRKIGSNRSGDAATDGVDQPDYGFLLDTMAVPSGGVLACSGFLQARIEPEIAFWLAEDLRGSDITAEQVLAATQGVSAALEVVDSRITNWRITLVDTIADNASSGRMIVSESVIAVNGLDLAAVKTVLTRNGEPVGTGTGAAVLGHPARAVAWLANKLAEFGVTLQADQVVLSGSMCGAVPFAPGDIFRATFTELGEASISFM